MDDKNWELYCLSEDGQSDSTVVWSQVSWSLATTKESHGTLRTKNVGSTLIHIADLWYCCIHSAKRYDYVLASPRLSLVPITGFPSCLTNPLYLVPDLEDCHIFYQCDLNPHPMSCGDMMFNSHRQVQYHSVYLAILNIPAPNVLLKVHTKVVAQSFRCATGHLWCSN